MRVVKVPTEELAYNNAAVVAPSSFEDGTFLQVSGREQDFLFTAKTSPLVGSGEIAFALPQRKWAKFILGEEVNVKTRAPPDYITGISFDVDFNSQKSATTDPLDTDEMAGQLVMQFSNRAFTIGELVVFKFVENEKKKSFILKLVVKKIEVMGKGSDPQQALPTEGLLHSNSAVIFDREEGASINLIGKSKGKSAYRSIINPDWDFTKLGIGGLDKEFTIIFRRAFASRVYPPEFIEQMGLKHVRGILLYGPPGTGKTLIARQIGKMLNACEPKIVNGPQILDKYVGESEANIRKLFADAEEEQKRRGSNSGLHIIIFDEIDAICKQRGSMAGSSPVHDTVVNQLLSKMDGVEQLNNILVIGMTNRRDMIDEALLRPGRMEVQMEISLPDEFGRLQILKIHTARMREYKKLGEDVNLEHLAKKTKNFSGAELEGLIRAAQSSAMNGLVKMDQKAVIDPEAVEKLVVNMSDFENALENDIKPAFGCADDKLESFMQNGLTMWGEEVADVLHQGELLCANAQHSNMGYLCCLSGLAKSGKSSLAVQIAKMSGFPFIKVVSAIDVAGYSESAKCQILKKAFGDALRPPQSVLLIDDIEELVDYCAVGPRFSNIVLRTLTAVLKQNIPAKHHLLVLATCSDSSFLREFGFTRIFHKIIDVPLLSKPEHIMNVVDETDFVQLAPEQRVQLERGLTAAFQRGLRGVGIKSLIAMLNTIAHCKEDHRVKQLCGELEDYALQL